MYLPVLDEKLLVDQTVGAAVEWLVAFVQAWIVRLQQTVWDKIGQFLVFIDQLKALFLVALLGRQIVSAVTFPLEKEGAYFVGAIKFDNNKKNFVLI